MTVTGLTTKEKRLARNQEFERVVRLLMDQHGLQDWSLADFGRAELGEKSLLWGMCDWTNKVISFPIAMLSNKPPQFQRDIILHEIAHALAPTGSTHDDHWATIAEQLGISRRSIIRDLREAANDVLNSSEERRAIRFALRRRTRGAA